LVEKSATVPETRDIEFSLKDYYFLAHLVDLLRSTVLLKAQMSEMTAWYE